MELKNVKYIGSAARFEQCLKTDLPQIAFLGKSNVGKSSLINMLCGDGKLARVSKTPGRTRMINYFSAASAELVLADLPGYGFARVSEAQREGWQELIEGYLEHEPQLAHLFFLVDIRHDAGEGDRIMYNYLFKSGAQFTIIATKADKVPQSRLHQRISELAAIYKVGRDDIIAASAQTNLGKDKLLRRIEAVLAAATVDETVSDEAVSGEG